MTYDELKEFVLHEEEFSDDDKQQVLDQMLNLVKTEPEQVFELCRQIAEINNEHQKDLIKFLGENEELYQSLLAVHGNNND